MTDEGDPSRVGNNGSVAFLLHLHLVLFIIVILAFDGQNIEGEREV